jgi:uncharacterized protein with HEPN domain
MSNEFLDFVEDIFDAMDNAEMFLHDISYDQFKDDLRTSFAVVRALEIIGEATKRLPTGIREEYPDVPWRNMAGMRDRIIHGYDTVDLHIVWDVVKVDIPQIKPRIQRILADYEAQD